MPIQYCERIENEYWAEPLNAITNICFIICAIILFKIFVKKQDLITKKYSILILILLIFAIGVGSWLFHTHATRWAMLSDVIPIALFIIFYTWFASRVFCELSWIGSGIITAMVIIVSLLIPSVTNDVPAAYLTAIAAMLSIGSYLRFTKNKEVGKQMLFAALVFVISLSFRQLDQEVCAAIPIGTHFLWHILNSLVLFVLVRACIVYCSGIANNAPATEGLKNRPK